jgi:urease accessory protein
MSDPTALQRLLTWLSPAFPVGAFAWSAGFETAIAERRVVDAAGLRGWIQGLLAHGGLRTDAILLAHAHRAVDGPLPPAPIKGEVPPGDNGTAAPQARSDTLPLVGRAGEGESKRLADLAELALALTPAAERHKETLLTGEAFIAAARAWPSDIYSLLPDPCPYPIAVGAIAAAHGVGLEETLLGYLTAAVHAQVSVAIRLVPLGQTAGLKVVAALEPQVAALARAAATAALDEIGGIAYAADIAQMRHEILEPRVFRS